MAEWEGGALQIPGTQYVEPVRGVLETLVVFLDIAKVLLQTIELFLIDFGNPIRGLVEILIKEIKLLLESLAQSGLYMYVDAPDPRKDPNLWNHVGGFEAFTGRFKSSLLDSRDPFRPQPEAGLVQSGFLLLVADARGVPEILRLVKILLRFFGREFSAPAYPPPSNAKVVLAGQRIGTKGAENTDPLLQVASVFSNPIAGFALEWSMGSAMAPPNPGFSDLVQQLGTEFVPSKWLIEKTSRADGPEILTVDAETTFEGPLGPPVKRKERVRHEDGDLVRVFEKYIVIDTTYNPESFFLGQLGTFRWLDTDVQPGKAYYYRIRAFSGDLSVTPSHELTFPEPELNDVTGVTYVRWPSVNPKEPVVMGRPSGVLSIRLPVVPANFDTMMNLENVFLAAFALGFHIPLSPDAEFDSKGFPTGDTSPVEVGRGLLTDRGGILTNIIPTPTAQNMAIIPDPVDQKFPDVYWNRFLVRQQAKRLAQAVGSSLLENSNMLNPFRDMMHRALAYPLTPPSGTNFVSPSNMEAALIQFLALPPNFPKTYDLKVYTTYDYAYLSTEFRLNLMSVVRFLTSFTLGGTPPDWITVSVMRDVIPWSGRMLYDLMANIDALLAAFKSIQDEMGAFIDTLERKIEGLERFLKFIIRILNFLESMDAGFYALFVPSTGGGIPDWIRLLDTATGTKPNSGPGGYSAGIALAWSGTDIEAFVKAMGILF